MIIFITVNSSWQESRQSIQEVEEFDELASIKSKIARFIKINKTLMQQISLCKRKNKE